MTIKNFTEHLSKHELKKGEDYFRRKKVTKLKETDDDEWTAIVNGREPYEVEISLDDEEIIDVSCECVAHAEDEYCKHVIAVLLAIQEKEGLLKTASANELETIVNNLSIEALRMIVLDYAKKDQSLKNTLIGMQESKEQEDKNINRYSALINQMAPTTTGTKEKGKPSQFINATIELQKKAEKAYSEKKYLTAAEIILALIKTVPAAASRVDYIHPAVVTEVVAEGFEILLDIVSDDEHVDLDADDLIWKHALQHVKDAAYPFSQYETHWIDLMAWIALTTPEQQSEVLQIVSELTAIAKTKKNKKDMERLTELAEFYNDLDEEDEENEDAVQETTSAENADLKKLEAAIKNKQYSAAKQIAEQAMQEAQKRKDTKRYEEIKFMLMSALQRSSDVLAFRALAHRFYEENRDSRYYAMWKGTYILSEWQKVSAELIEKLERNIFAYAAGKGNPAELADVYVKEHGYTKSLLNLLKKAPRLAFINEYVEGFNKSFAAELLQLYKDALLSYAVNNKTAKEHVDFLLSIEKMQALKGGMPAVQALAAEIKVKNPELYKLLPEGVKK